MYGSLFFAPLFLKMRPVQGYFADKKPPTPQGPPP